ncbi:1991_t:CDS:2 [Funneliformis caledonium]|uniref:1991_t:CDS:1 n=1 Tax=Funneliformis caledonium TaxID=1117310 RepID=A0A9N9F2V5_9GLOM|nr:1991_t:CDS:2 [Funneliformis caledonium]
MKMLKAKLYHLPLSFNTSHKPNSFYYCDTTNCSISLSFHTDSVDENVQSLLTRLQQFDEIKVKKDDDNILCDDDDENEPIRCMIFTLEEALQKFQLQ